MFVCCGHRCVPPFWSKSPRHLPSGGTLRRHGDDPRWSNFWGWFNDGKTMDENHAKIMGKSWENDKNHGNPMEIP